MNKIIKQIENFEQTMSKSELRQKYIEGINPQKR